MNEKLSEKISIWENEAEVQHLQGLIKRMTSYKPVNDKKLEKVLAYKTSNLIFALLLKTKDDSVAQLVEQYTFNVWALGSSPSGITN